MIPHISYPWCLADIRFPSLLRHTHWCMCHQATACSWWKEIKMCTWTNVMVLPHKSGCGRNTSPPRGRWRIGITDDNSVGCLGANIVHACMHGRRLLEFSFIIIVTTLCFYSISLLFSTLHLHAKSLASLSLIIFGICLCFGLTALLYQIYFISSLGVCTYVRTYVHGGHVMSKKLTGLFLCSLHVHKGPHGLWITSCNLGLALILMWLCIINSTR